MHLVKEKKLNPKSYTDSVHFLILRKNQLKEIIFYKFLKN